MSEKRSEVALAKMRRRANGLIKMIDMKMPDLILVTQSMMILEAASSLDYAAVEGGIGGRLAASARKLSGFCTESDCENPIVPDSTFDYCAAHEAEAIKQLSEGRASCTCAMNPMGLWNCCKCGASNEGSSRRCSSAACKHFSQILSDVDL